MKKLMITAPLALVLASCQQAGNAPEGNATAPAENAGAATSTPITAPAGTYTIDPDHAVVIARISHLGLSHYPVEFTKVSGTLTIDPAKPQDAQLEATVQISSLRTPYTSDYRAAHPKATEASFEESLLTNAELFDAAKFPTATFKSEKITPTGTNTADVEGKLTLHGITKPATLRATFRGGMAAGEMHPDMPAALGFSATTTIKRSEFGITAMTGMLGEDVQLDIETDLHLKPAK